VSGHALSPPADSSAFPGARHPTFPWSILAECPALHAMAIQRDVIWPKAAGPLRRRPDEKADGPVAIQFHRIASGDNALDRASAIASVAVEAVAVADVAVQRIQALCTLVDRRGSRGDPSNATDHSPRQGGSNPPPDPCGACPIMRDRGFHSAPRVTPRPNRVDSPELASRRPARPGCSK
jgi:hypothetical protein